MKRYSIKCFGLAAFQVKEHSDADAATFGNNYGSVQKIEKLDGKGNPVKVVFEREKEGRG